MGSFPGDRIRKLLTEKGHPVADLSRKTGIGISTMSNILSLAEPVGPKRQKKIEDGLFALGFTRDELARLFKHERAAG